MTPKPKARLFYTTGQVRAMQTTWDAERAALLSQRDDALRMLTMIQRSTEEWIRQRYAITEQAPPEPPAAAVEPTTTQQKDGE